ncbi:cell division cycle 25 homolog d isoform X1 [Megalobrama amblycephala]|uniref:cell division cycle 25 homolog d isoform X1 n=1 Tax=Megalobrama amblycephala TaxID=75352 RepID=UPI00201435D0|nr:cell division cycle 25 homolog d isoform X1 [Megalobrama amblycephala]
MAGDALEAVWDPTAEDSSPVSELSLSLQNLQCQDGPKISPAWRKLVLTPECISPPLNTLSRDRETPTVSAVRRRRARSLSPDSSSNTSGCLWRGRHDSPANKETERAFKRLRVRLCSRFSADEAEAAGRSWRQCRSDPEEDASHPRQVDALDPTAVARFSQMRSRHEAPPTDVTQDTVADLSLIGDFSKQHLLPVERAGHPELHCVSAQTVASLIRGQFGPAVEDFLIVDCRYPYEYQGGHIKGAVNLYTESQIQQAVHQASAGALPLCAAGNGFSRRLRSRWAARPSDSLPEEEVSSPRKLIVFHCEFSSERGPHLCRYLRRLDRCVNAQVYPNLHYPELYLLLGGYKHFHASYPDLCDPCGYVPMRQREYREQLHGFRRKRPTRQRRRRPIRIHQRTTH